MEGERWGEERKERDEGGGGGKIWRERDGGRIWREREGGRTGGRGKEGKQ